MSKDTIDNSIPWDMDDFMNCHISMDAAVEFELMLKDMRDYLESYKEQIKSMPVRPSRDESVAEAARRMEALGFLPKTIEEFRKHGKISCAMENGCPFPLEEPDRSQIQDLERKGFSVYAAIRNDTAWGRMTAYITVSNNGADWIAEREWMKQDILMAYVLNHDVPIFSEMGTITVRRLHGGMFDRIIPMPALIPITAYDLWL